MRWVVGGARSRDEDDIAKSLQEPLINLRKMLLEDCSLQNLLRAENGSSRFARRMSGCWKGWKGWKGASWEIAGTGGNIGWG